MKVGVIKTLNVGDDTQSFIPFDERFIMGGNGIPYGNALRGYPDNSVGPQTASGQAVDRPQRYAVPCVCHAGIFG